MKTFYWRKLLRNSLISLFLSLSLVALTPSLAQAASFTRKPFLQNVTSSSVEFRWVTDTNEALTVKYGATTSYGNTVTSDTVMGTGGSNNHAKITGLSPNTKYYYQVLAGSTALTTAGDANHYFQTAPSVGSTSPFSFVFWGDSGNASTAQNNVAKQVFNKKPNLAFIAGDIAYPYSSDFINNNSLHFNQYNDSKAGQNSMSFAPYYVTCGNHETSCPTVMADHSLPGGGSVAAQSTYSFDYGNVHFVALNSNGSYSYNATSPQNSDPQIKWAYNDLKASSQPWKVVYWHHNGWSAGSHSSNSAIVDNIIRMASDAGADIVFWGHSHVYERWNKKAGFYPSVQAITIGNGGQTGASSCTSTSPGPGCAARSTSSSEAGFVWAEVSGDTMTMHYIRSDGSEGDRFTLNSGGTVTTIPSPTSTATATPRPTNTPTPISTNTPTPQPTVTPTITPTPTPSMAYLYMSPTSQTRVGLGVTNTINTAINPWGKKVASIELMIKFDPSVVRVDSITPGGFFTSPGVGTPVEINKNIDNQAGTVHDVISFPLGSNYYSTAIDIPASITFTTVGYGTSIFSYVITGVPRTNVSDINAQDVLGQATSGSVTVISSISATPTPRPTNTPTPKPTNSPTPQPTATVTLTPSPKPTLTLTPTPKPTATLTLTPSPKPTVTVTLTPTPKPTLTLTPTPKPTATPALSGTPTPTLALSPTTIPTTTATPAVSITPTGSNITPTPGVPITYEGCKKSEGDWEEIKFARQTGSFMAEFDATPDSQNPSHHSFAYVGFSSNEREDFTSMGAIISFDPTGKILARNGQNYTATRVVNYDFGKTYHFRFIIDITGRVYSVYVTPPGGIETQIAANFAFRIEQRRATSLNTLELYSRTKKRSLEICNLTITPLAGSVLSPAITGKLPRGRIPKSSPTPTPEPTVTPLPLVTGDLTVTPTLQLTPAGIVCKPNDGDDNGDGDIDFDDFSGWRSHYKHYTTEGPHEGDFNCSGLTDGIDYVIWLNGYRKTHH